MRLSKGIKNTQRLMKFREEMIVIHNRINKLVTVPPVSYSELRTSITAIRDNLLEKILAEDYQPILGEDDND